MAKKKSVSRRQMIRDQRNKKQRQQRLIMILVVGGIALIVAGLLIAPSIRDTLTPVGEVVEITPREHPMPDGRAMGDPNAPVLVEVWEDFQCPACKNYSQEIEPLITDKYVATGQARYVFRQWPFLDQRSATKESHQSANASMCAAEQERFWDYHDILFANWDGENRGAFSDKRLLAFAETLTLEMDQFKTCFEANSYEDEINQDKNAGTQAGVTGTPSVFVNGRQLSPGYVPTFDEIAAAIEAELGT
jgi:protein-disulfide isomerase